jgi:hypothetical protein
MTAQDALGGRVAIVEPSGVCAGEVTSGLRNCQNSLRFRIEGVGKPTAVPMPQTRRPGAELGTLSEPVAKDAATLPPKASSLEFLKKYTALRCHMG